VNIRWAIRRSLRFCVRTVLWNKFSVAAISEKRIMHTIRMECSVRRPLQQKSTYPPDIRDMVCPRASVTSCYYTPARKQNSLQ
jgi:hypothetical protein